MAGEICEAAIEKLEEARHVRSVMASAFNAIKASLECFGSMLTDPRQQTSCDFLVADIRAYETRFDHLFAIAIVDTVQESDGIVAAGDRNGSLPEVNETESTA